MNFTGIIPARYASTRFPGKPLIDLAGKSMIQRVYEQCLLSKSLSDVIIATDDERIAKHASSFGAKVCITSETHQSGTDRCAEVAEKMNLDGVVINIQGDEPLINPSQIDELCECFDDDNTEIATLIRKIENSDILFNPNSPKVIINKDQFAIYFSRESIPHIRNTEKTLWLNLHTFYQHVGIYAYRIPVLKKITLLPPSLLEKAEALEQLRWIENSYKIKTALTTFETVAIDSPEDVAKVLDLIRLTEN